MHHSQYNNKKDTTFNIIINKSKELQTHKTKTIDINMNINKYNINYYLHNNNNTLSATSNSYNNNNNNHSKSRNKCNNFQKQSLSLQTNEPQHKKHSVLLTTTTIGNSKRRSEDSSLMIFPNITSVPNSHRYSFDNNKRSPNLTARMRKDTKQRNDTSDSNSSLKIISESGRLRKLSLINNRYCLDETQDDNNNNNMLNKDLVFHLEKDKQTTTTTTTRFNLLHKYVTNIKSTYKDTQLSNETQSQNDDTLKHFINPLLSKTINPHMLGNQLKSKRRQSLQINILTNKLNSECCLNSHRNSHHSNSNNNNKTINISTSSRKHQRESFLQKYTRSLTTGEQYNYFSFFINQINNYEEDNVSQIEAENFVNNMFDLVNEAQETNKHSDVVDDNDINFKSSVYLKWKSTIINSFTKGINDKCKCINNNIISNKQSTLNNSFQYVKNIISSKIENKSVCKSFALYLENNIYNSISDEVSKKEILRMSLSFFEHLRRYKNNNNNNNSSKRMNGFCVPKYKSLLLKRYFDVKREIEDFIFSQEYIFPKKKSLHSHLTRRNTLNKRQYLKAHKIENYIRTSYDKKDNMLFVNYFVDKDTYVYILSDYISHNNNTNTNHNKYSSCNGNNNIKSNRFSICGSHSKAPQLKLTLTQTIESKRHSTMHMKLFNYNSPQQIDKTIIHNKPKILYDNDNNIESSTNIIPYRDSLLYKLTCINNQQLILPKNDCTLYKDFSKVLNTNKSLITNESLFICNKETQKKKTITEQPSKQETLPEFKSNALIFTLTKPNKHKLTKTSIPSSLSKLLSRTIDKRYLNNQIGTNLYKTIMFHISNNNPLIVQTLILDNKDRLNINYQNEDGDTFIITAIKNKCTSIIQFLLQHGNDPNIPNQYKNSPLHYALSLQHYDVANMLIAYGANENALNTRALSPWQCIGITLD